MLPIRCRVRFLCFIFLLILGIIFFKLFLFEIYVKYFCISKVEFTKQGIDQDVQLLSLSPPLFTLFLSSPLSSNFGKNLQFTPSFIDLENSILFLDKWNHKYPYILERTLHSSIQRYSLFLFRQYSIMWVLHNLLNQCPNYGHFGLSLVFYYYKYCYNCNIININYYIITIYNCIQCTIN